MLLAAKNGESTQGSATGAKWVLVVSDRFPQAEISGFYYDGRGLASNVRPGKSACFWRSATAFIPTNGAISPGINYSPGHDIETAISRKPDHDYAELQDKSVSCRRLAITAQKFLRLIPGALQRSAGTGTEGGFSGCHRSDRRSLT